MRDAPVPARWFCYLLECADGTYYTGITNDVEKRLRLHNRGMASRYTRGRLPVKMVHAEHHADRSSAAKREREIRKMSRAAKQALTVSP
ncbi:MAG: GIY-YIG nuclease family protein [Deltaproteobacteria bacterium]|nr:GIY-YIG nuclease family protein [Deltaproteobacteria bacterium]